MYLRFLLTFSHDNHSCDDDTDQGKDFDDREYVLYPGCPFYTQTIHERQRGWNAIKLGLKEIKLKNTKTWY